MKRIILPVSICLFLLISLTAPASSAQLKLTQPPPRNGGRGISLTEAGLSLPKPAELRFDPNAIPFRVDPPSPVSGGAIRPQSANIVYDYIQNATNALGDACTTFPAQAVSAINAAAAIWGSLISSPVPIRIEVCFANLPPGILGHSSPLNFIRDFPNAPQPGTYYPLPLANAYYGSDLDPGYDDISIAYANAYISTFYFGTDGNDGGLTDFESVILHEIGHGLGFLGSIRGDTGTLTAQWGLCNTCPPAYPMIYDRFTVNNAGNLLISTYPGKPSWTAGLYSNLTSGNIFFTGASAKAANGGNRVPLYAPSPWNDGSSYAHLAESFNGTPNALMTFSIGTNEVLHAPGPVAMGLLADIGWLKIAAPSGLVVTPFSANQLDLSWVNNGSGETGYKFERSNDDTSHWAVLTTTSTSATAYSDTTVVEGTRYYYRISAVYPNSQTSAASPAVAGISPLKVATGLTATPVSPTQINLAWTDPNTTETGYKVERSPDGSSGWSTLITTGANVQSYSDIGLTEFTHYFYRVSAVNAIATSPTVPVDAISLLVAPTGLTASPISPTQVNLTWTDASGKETGYVVSRGPAAAGPWSVLTTTIAGATSYSDITAVEGSAYFYEVYAVNAISASTATVTPAAVIVPLKAATGVNAALGAAGQVVVSWNDTSANEKGYRVERSATGSDPWMDLTPVLLAANANRFEDTTVAEASHFTYRVTAVNTSTSAQSTPAVSNAVSTPLAPPGNLEAVPMVGGGKILIQWIDASAAETGYEIQFDTSMDGPWILLITTAANINTYLWLQPIEGIYFIRVRAIGSPESQDSVYVYTSATLSANTNWIFVPIITR